MTVEEIFTQLAEHMLKGIMMHEQMADSYSFLNLQGYKQCHEYHYFSEILNYRSLCHYSLGHCDKLIRIGEIKTPALIDTSWYKHTRPEVDINTRRTAIRNLIKSWVDWEKETKKLFETSYKSLYDMGEIAAAMKVGCFVKDVDDELKSAVSKQICLETTGYDMGIIIEEQHALHEKYKDKIACLRWC